MFSIKSGSSKNKRKFSAILKVILALIHSLLLSKELKKSLNVNLLNDLLMSYLAQKDMNIKHSTFWLMKESDSGSNYIQTGQLSHNSLSMANLWAV
jgi:hypothetical protein